MSISLPTYHMVDEYEVRRHGFDPATIMLDDGPLGHWLDLDAEVAEGDVVVYHSTYGRLTACVVIDRTKVRSIGSDIDSREEAWAHNMFGLLAVDRVKR
jgi:hypothetical protein